MKKLMVLVLLMLVVGCSGNPETNKLMVINRYITDGVGYMVVCEMENGVPIKEMCSLRYDDFSLVPSEYFVPEMPDSGNSSSIGDV